MSGLIGMVDSLRYERGILGIGGAGLPFIHHEWHTAGRR